MSYAQVTDVQNRYPAQDLIDLTDPNGQAMNGTLVQQALNDASAEIDGYIATRYQLPIGDAPQRLVALCCDIAVYRLQTLRPLRDLEDCRKLYEDAVAFLKRVSDGKASIGITPDTGIEPAQPPTSVVVEGAGAVRTGSAAGKRVFTRETMRSL
jgi:phage gp36-like protein